MKKKFVRQVKIIYSMEFSWDSGADDDWEKAEPDIFLACFYPNLENVRAFTEQPDFRPNAREPDLDPEQAESGYTALHRAVLGGNGEIVRHLLEKGADANMKCLGMEQTPLHLAAREAQYEIITILIEEGNADINLQDGFGDSALHLLSQHSSDREEIIAYLLKMGADPTLKNKDDKLASINH